MRICPECGYDTPRKAATCPSCLVIEGRTVAMVEREEKRTAPTAWDRMTPGQRGIDAMMRTNHGTLDR
jgi:hypothetical protein